MSVEIGFAVKRVGGTYDAESLGAKTVDYDDGGLVEQVKVVNKSDPLPGGTDSVSVAFLDVPANHHKDNDPLTVSVDKLEWIFSPTGDAQATAYGTYRVRLTQNGESVVRVFRIKTPNAGLSIPALNERAHEDANLTGNGQLADFMALPGFEWVPTICSGWGQS
jgi:hypothetical protein